MCFEWTCYLELARDLKTRTSDSNKEAKLRSSISRAYYASYCHTRNYMIDNEGFINNSRTPHQALIEELELKDIKHRAIAVLLGRLKNYRVHADYFNEFENIDDKADTSILLAEKIMDKLSKLNT